MVRLEEVEDEAFVEKPESSKDDALLMDDDADYTDTGEHIVLSSPQMHHGGPQKMLSCSGLLYISSIHLPDHCFVQSTF